MPELEDNFVEVMGECIAGDPMKGDVVWTILTQQEIADSLGAMGTPVSTEVVRQLLDDFDFSKRKAQKSIAMGDYPYRDEQYDLRRNVGHITLGRSHDTSEFACDSVFTWWCRYGQRAYPDATELLLLCDCGGRNNYRHHIFKEDLQRLVNRIDMPIRIAHSGHRETLHSHHLHPHGLASHTQRA